MMRVCHLNTCPVGVATQDPELRRRFEGQPEHVVNYLFMVAEELREIMARLGVRSIAELIGRVDLLEPDDAVEHWKARGIDLRPLLECPTTSRRTRRATACAAPTRCSTTRSTWTCSSARGPPSRTASTCALERRIENKNRAVGGLLSGEIARRYGEQGLTEGSIEVRFTGSAGQSFGAWLASGVTLELRGRRQRLHRQGHVGRHARRAPGGRGHLPRRGERDRRQHRPVRRDLGQGVLPRPRRRALRGPQLGRRDGRRGRRRPRLRVHDRRARGRARAAPGSTSRRA